jgi:choline dehydrogenase
MAKGESFDYVVVGAGASGCVVAHRLATESSASVLLLEAGPPDENDAIHDIGAFVSIWGSDLDWKLATTEQRGMGGREIVINQGRVAGGSTSINAMMYVKGNRRNYDQWSAMGADGWSYDDVLPYFNRSEKFAPGASKYHGGSGPLPVTICPDPAMRSEPFMNAAVELGYDGPYWDVNGERQENGAGLLHFNVDENGRRASGATAFLAPIQGRKNFTLRTGAEASRVTVEKGRATGVEYVQDGKTHTVHANKEVILSAGAFLSPKLLMLSGIGPADHLAEHGISVVSDLPGVGQNLQDHVQLPVVFQLKKDLPNPTLLTGNVLFVNTRDGASAAPPDLQMNFTPAVPQPLAPVLQLPVPACIFLPILVQPFSIGEVTLRSSDPADPPVINPNYLSQEADVQALRKAVELARALAATSAFSDLVEAELVPGDGDVDEHIRTQSSTLWHPAGTCKMGHDALAVVDPQLRVRGVEGLRVADASVMPTVTSGNTVAACFMIGEKVADMILNG